MKAKLLRFIRQLGFFYINILSPSFKQYIFPILARH